MLFKSPSGFLLVVKAKCIYPYPAVFSDKPNYSMFGKAPSNVWQRINGGQSFALNPSPSGPLPLQNSFRLNPTASGRLSSAYAPFQGGPETDSEGEVQLAERQRASGGIPGASSSSASASCDVVV